LPLALRPSLWQGGARVGEGGRERREEGDCASEGACHARAAR
jgi:hypothetical protein